MRAAFVALAGLVLYLYLKGRNSTSPASTNSGIGSFTSLSELANAFANAEGFGTSGTIPTQANNPGDLELGDIGYGTVVASGGNRITVFPSVDAGMTALKNQIEGILSGSSQYYDPSESLSDISDTYAGGSSTWANNVASQLGVSPDAPIGSYAPDEG